MKGLDKLKPDKSSFGLMVVGATGAKAGDFSSEIKRQ
tara:strand:- start:160 stop:270 length:111 start_codon:yes stop_codon:yes gene_type:complete